MADKNTQNFVNASRKVGKTRGEIVALRADFMLVSVQNNASNTTGTL